MWTNELAFVVAFGTLFAKVWRLYKVFFNKKMVQRVKYWLINVWHISFSLIFRNIYMIDICS